MSEEVPGEPQPDAAGKSSRFKMPSRKKKNPGASSAKAAGPEKKKNPVARRNVIAAGATALFAIVGVLLLESYIQGEEEDAALARQKQPVLIVASTVNAGNTLDELLSEQPSRIGLQEITPEAVVSGAFGSLEALVAYQESLGVGPLMLDADLVAGEQITESKLSPVESFSRRVSPVAVPAGHHQLTLVLPPTRALGGLIRPGDDVSVVASFNAQSGQDQTSAIILSSVEVVNVQVENQIAEDSVRSDADNPNLAPTGDYLITVAVTSNELTKLTYATEYGRIVLAAASDAPLDGGTNAQNIETVLTSSPEPQSAPGSLAFAGDTGDLLGNDPVAVEEEAGDQ